MKQFQEEVTGGNAVPLSAEDELLLNPAHSFGPGGVASSSTARVAPEIDPGVQPEHDAGTVADYDSKESVDIPPSSQEPGAASVIHLPGPVSAPSRVRVVREDHSRHWLVRPSRRRKRIIQVVVRADTLQPRPVKPEPQKPAARRPIKPSLFECSS